LPLHVLTGKLENVRDTNLNEQCLDLAWKHDPGSLVAIAYAL
jgi:hypothetical protein